MQPTDLPFVAIRSDSPLPVADIQPIRQAQAEAEKTALQAALAASGNNKARAAKLLGIHRTQLYKKMKKHGLEL